MSVNSNNVQYNNMQAYSSPQPPQNRVRVGDSENAVVYMSATNLPANKWICKSCGTRNRLDYNACEVCGLLR